MLPDHELVRRCLDGNAPAQKEFYHRFAPRMMGVCYRYVQNVGEAEDVLQEGFIKAFRDMKQFRNEGSLEGWLRRIMVNSALNFLNHEKYFRSEIDLEFVRTAPSDSPDALDLMENNEVMEMIGELSYGYRTVLNLFAIDGYSHREIGEMMGIGESTSRSQYARARQLLLRKVEEKNLIKLVHERAEQH